MFLRPSTLNSLMKQAYKGTGLAVARHGDWIYIAGGYWECEIMKDYMPNVALGNLISLIGELPEEGQRICVTKDASQIEIERPIRVRDHMPTETLTVTDVILLGTQEVVQRLVQDKTTGHVYAVNNVFITIVDNSQAMEDKGELLVSIPFHDGTSMLWKNNVCKLRALFRCDEKNDKFLKNTAGADITPEVKQE